MTHRALSLALLLSGCADTSPVFDFYIGVDLRAEVDITDDGTLTATADDGERSVELVVRDARRGRLPRGVDLPDGLQLNFIDGETTTTEADLEWYLWDYWATPEEGFHGSTSWATESGQDQGFVIDIGGEAPEPSPWSCWADDDSWCAEGHARDEGIEAATARCSERGGTLRENEDSCIDGAPEPTGNCSTVYFYDTCGGSEPWVQEVCQSWGDLDYFPAPGCSP
jgi:hypothetical protein